MRRSLVCLVAFLLCAGPATAETCTYAYVIGIRADDLRKHTERSDEGFSTRETVYLYFGNGGALEHGLAFPGKYSRGRDLHVCREMLATLPPKTYDTVVLHWPGETLTLRIGGDSPRDYHRGWTSIQFGHLRAFTGPLPQI